MAYSDNPQVASSYSFQIYANPELEYSQLHLPLSIAVYKELKGCKV